MFPSAAQVQGAPCYSRRWKYGVHFCFNDQEIEDRLIGHFKNAFHLKGIKTTIEDLENARGEEISQIAEKAIQQSRSSIVVFCRKFAFNPRCLDELATILDCKLRYQQLVHPLIFKIAPAEVRHVRGCYEEAMKEHLIKFMDGMKVTKWKVSLCNAANLFGSHFLSGSESQLIDQIVEDISVRIHDPSCNANCLGGRQLCITEPKIPFGPGSCDGVDTVGENGIEGTVNGGGTQYDVTHAHIRGCKSTNSKNARRNHPNDAGLQPFFTGYYCRKVPENGERFIMGQPSTSAGSTSKWMDIPLAPEMMGRFSTDAGSLAMRTTEEVKYLMQILLAFVYKGFRELLSVGSIFKELMEEKVLPFCADEKIPQDLIEALEKMLLSFTHWSRYYQDANAKLEATKADSSKFHQLQKQVEALRNESKQAGNGEREGDDLLERLQKRKSALEEQIKAVTDEIANLNLFRQTLDEKNRTRLDEFKKVEAAKDKLEIQLPHIKGEHERALLTQKYIEDQWLELVRGFKETFSCLTCQPVVPNPIQRQKQMGPHLLEVDPKMHYIPVKVL